jgi:flagellar hook-associated protein 2
MVISTINSSTNRISGLASGLDTEELVTQLTSTTQSKIDSAYQQKQILEWKQEYYQEIASKMDDFCDKYFSSSSNIAEQLSELTSTSNSSCVTAIASSSASTGTLYIDDIISLATSCKLTGSQTVSPELAFIVDTENLNQLSGKYIKITLDGVSKTVTFGDGEYSSIEDVSTELQSLVDDAFGNGRISISHQDGKLSLYAETSTLSISKIGTEGSEALDVLGFDTATDVSSNRLNLSSTTLGSLLSLGEGETIEFSINNNNFTFDSTTTLSKVMSSINASEANVTIAYSKLSDTFSITSKETGSASKVELSDISGSFLSKIMGSDGGILSQGKDAVLTVSLDGSTDGSNLVTITRSTNTFSIDGVSYTLKSMASGDAKEQITVNTTLDTENIASKIKDFIADYNSLLDSITSKLNETKYKDFPPLTDAQKEELSESEQKTWTEKAKSGLLRNDSTLNEIYNQLRNCMYSTVAKLDGSGESLGIILADTGITTGAYTEYGKLKIDEKALTKALNENAQGIISLFAQKSSIAFSVYNSTELKTQRTQESGLLYKLSDILKTNLNATGKKGSLITLIGNPDSQFTGITTYSKKISDLESTISNLKEKLSNEQDRYWTKFTSMETAINTLNSQSAWLLQQTSS